MSRGSLKFWVVFSVRPRPHDLCHGWDLPCWLPADPHVKMRRAKRGFSWVVAGNSVFHSSGDGYFGGTSWVASRVSRNLLRLKKEGGLSLATSQRERASSHIERRISRFFLSCGSKYGAPLKLQRGPQGPARVSAGKSGLHASCEGPLGIALQFVLRPRDSSGVEAGNSGHPSSADMDLRDPMEFP